LGPAPPYQEKSRPPRSIGPAGVGWTDDVAGAVAIAAGERATVLAGGWAVAVVGAPVPAGVVHADTPAATRRAARVLRISTLQRLGDFLS
jgi:hypothetical protein